MSLFVRAIVGFIRFACLHGEIVDVVPILEFALDLCAPVSVANLVQVGTPWTTVTLASDRDPSLLHWTTSAQDRVKIMND